MDLSIIIVSYNTRSLLRRCLESVVGGQASVTKKKPATDYWSLATEIIVVDNGSKDGSEEVVTSNQRSVTREKKPVTIRLIKNRINLGFSKANNQGIKIAQGKYILLLNSDTEVKPGALEKLVEFAKKHAEAGIIGAKLLNPDGFSQPSVYHFPTAGRAVKEYWLGQKGAYEKYAPKGENAVEVEALVGAAMLIPKRVFGKVGLLDERYFMYFEDLDFCRRVKKVGFKVYFLPQAEIIHHHGASGKEIPQETQKWLVASSKIYHGLLKHYLINLIIWSSQKWRVFFKSFLRRG